QVGNREQGTACNCTTPDGSVQFRRDVGMFHASYQQPALRLRRGVLQAERAWIDPPIAVAAAAAAGCSLFPVPYPAASRRSTPSSSRARRAAAVAPTCSTSSRASL